MFSGMDDEVVDWFELDDSEGDPSSDADRRFLSVLRDHAAADGWTCEPDDTQAFHVWVLDHHELKLVLSLVDRETRTYLLTYGMVFNGAGIVGDRVHDQTYDFELGTQARIERTGSPEYLATMAARWFAAILDWPIERREWIQYDRVIYREWVLAHTGEVITHTARRRAGGPPDRVALVRGTHVPTGEDNAQ